MWISFCRDYITHKTQNQNIEKIKETLKITPRLDYTIKQNIKNANILPTQFILYQCTKKPKKYKTTHKNT